MEDIAIIADKDTLLGFKLVGLKRSFIFSEDTIKEDLNKINDAKVLIVTENVAMFIKSKSYKVVPIMIEIPDKNGSNGHALSEISKLFETAIGVALKEEN